MMIIDDGKDYFVGKFVYKPTSYTSNRTDLTYVRKKFKIHVFELISIYIALSLYKRRYRNETVRIRYVEGLLL